MKTRSKGFTLVELLVVIGIVGILLTISLVAINPGRQIKMANNAKRSADVLAILDAVIQYKIDKKGASPVTIPASATAIASTVTTPSMTDFCNAIVPKYIAALPTDPTTGTAFTTCAAAFTTGYTILETTSNGRITVAATAEAIDGTTPIISVTK